MKKGILVLSVFASLFFTSCEDKLLDKEDTNNNEIQLKEELINDNESKLQAIEHGEVEDPGDRGDKD